MAFNTGNPVPSSDGRDLSDNAETLDLLVNDTLETATTRTGKQVLTRRGLEVQYIQTAINGGIWDTGQTFTAFNQYMVFGNTAYKPKSSATLPYVVGATPIGDSNIEVVDTGTQVLTRLNPDTLADWQNDMSAQADDVVTTKDRIANNGGGATGDVISGVGTANGTNRVANNSNTLTWVLRVGAIANVKQLGAVGDGETDDRDAIKSAFDLRSEIFIPEGDFFVASKISVAINKSITGTGKGSTTISARGNYTVFEHTTRFSVSKLTLRQVSGTYEGIGFGNKRTDESDNQSFYCFFNQVSVIGFDFSWWIRCSVFLSWKDCHSKSLVGVRFARNADPYDVTSNAPAGWNTYSPTLGWFHNVGTMDDFNFEDVECGAWGCFMGYTLTSCTTQLQSGDKSENKIMPTSEDRTGVWMESGVTGNRDGWGNLINSIYAEACIRPLYIQDQKQVTITNAFVQGGSIDNKYNTPLRISNSSVTVSGYTGQDWFNDLAILVNNSTLIGRTAGAVGGNRYSIEDGSTHYSNPPTDSNKSMYTFNALLDSDVFTLPLTLKDKGTYTLILSGLRDGYETRTATYTIFVWPTIAPAIITRIGNYDDFDVSVSGYNIKVSKRTSGTFDFSVILINESADSVANTPLSKD